MALTAVITSPIGVKLAVLENVATPAYARRPRSATQITLAIPRDHGLLNEFSVEMRHALLNTSGARIPLETSGVLLLTSPVPLTRLSFDDEPSKASFLEHGNRLELWRGSELLASGRIEIRDVDNDWVSITAFTEEILLADALTPTQYAAVLDGLDVADIARACARAWHSIRVKTIEQWQEAISMTRVKAWEAASGSLWLERNENGAYHRNGYAIYEFHASDVPNFHSWERIRWSSDYPPEGLVYTTIQYRLGTSGAWIPSTNWPSIVDSENNPDPDGQTITGERGILPDQLGVLIDANNPVLQVRVNLYSDDPDSTEDGEEGTSGSSPVFFALEVLARTREVVSIGEVPSEVGHVVHGLRADNATVLSVLQQACEQAGVDFVVTRGVLSLVIDGVDYSSSENIVTQ